MKTTHATRTALPPRRLPWLCARDNRLGTGSARASGPSGRSSSATASGAMTTAVVVPRCRRPGDSRSARQDGGSQAQAGNSKPSSSRLGSPTRVLRDPRLFSLPDHADGARAPLEGHARSRSRWRGRFRRRTFARRRSVSSSGKPLSWGPRCTSSRGSAWCRRWPAVGVMLGRIGSRSVFRTLPLIGVDGSPVRGQRRRGARFGCLECGASVRRLRHRAGVSRLLPRLRGRPARCDRRSGVGSFELHCACVDTRWMRRGAN